MKNTDTLYNEFIVIDTETTGLSPDYDDIIEITLLHVLNKKVKSRYSTLIDPKRTIPEFITALTGITNEMLIGKPQFSDIREEIRQFIGDLPIIGHNVNFDVRFINYGSENMIIPNDRCYCDTLYLSRKVLPELKSHSLSTLKEYYKISEISHRSESDCLSTIAIYFALMNDAKDKNLNLIAKNKSHSNLRAKDLILNGVPNPDSIFYQKHVCFTGKLERYIRKDAWQIITNIGGYIDDSVTKNTDFLILGDVDYMNIQKSSKRLKAEKMMINGSNIKILPEIEFYYLIENIN